MKKASNSPPARSPLRRTNKTKYSFLRWLHKRNALKESATAPDKEQGAPPLPEELMSWVDAGGSVA